MGVEGVTPGTAYTLLTPKDSSFAVDLVQNLRLSGQPIAEDLIHLAMKDSKWNKIRHFHHQGGLGSGAGRFSSAPRHQGMGGSLSSFAGVNRAMTSEMMANGTQQAMQINLPQGLMQAYQEKIESRNMRTCEEEPKRKNRFSTGPIAVSNQPLTGFVASSLSSNPSTLHQSSNPSNPNNPLMRDFVKASSNYSSLSTSLQILRQINKSKLAKKIVGVEG